MCTQHLPGNQTHKTFLSILLFRWYDSITNKMVRCKRIQELQSQERVCGKELITSKLTPEFFLHIADLSCKLFNYVIQEQSVAFLKKIDGKSMRVIQIWQKELREIIERGKWLQEEEEVYIN